MLFAVAATHGAWPVLDHQPPIDDRHEVENLAMFCADQPVDPAVGKCAAQRSRHRDGMDDVAQGAEADNQEARQQSLYRLSKTDSAAKKAGVRRRFRGNRREAFSVDRAFSEPCQAG